MSRLKYNISGHDVFVHGLSSKELTDLPTPAMLILRAIRDENGVCVFNENDLSAINELPAKIMNELMFMIGELS